MTQPTLRPLDAHEIARRMGLTAPDERTLSRLDDALLDAEADVVGYLGRPIRPQTFVQEHAFPYVDGWQLPHRPLLEVVSAVAETFTDGSTTGLFTVTYRAGLDYENDPALLPIRRYVIAAVRNDPELLVFLQQAGQITPLVRSRSVGTEGQSLTTTYADVGYGGGGVAGQDSPGALPSKSSMDTWRIKGRRVHQAPPSHGAGFHGGGWR
jgi:hypothetical protein